VLQEAFNFVPFNLDQVWRQTLNEDLKPFSRAWVADQLEAMTGQKCSEAVINNWTAPSNGNYRTPAIMVPAICECTQSTRLIEVLTRPILPLLSKARLEGIAECDEIIRRAQTRRAELEGRNV
jgi:hypothetical protein